MRASCDLPYPEREVGLTHARPSGQFRVSRAKIVIIYGNQDEQQRKNVTDTYSDPSFAYSTGISASICIFFLFAVSPVCCKSVRRSIGPRRAKSVKAETGIEGAPSGESGGRYGGAGRCECRGSPSAGSQRCGLFIEVNGQTCIDMWRCSILAQAHRLLRAATRRPTTALCCAAGKTSRTSHCGIKKRLSAPSRHSSRSCSSKTSSWSRI